MLATAMVVPIQKSQLRRILPPAGVRLDGAPYSREPCNPLANGAILRVLSPALAGDMLAAVPERRAVFGTDLEVRWFGQFVGMGGSGGDRAVFGSLALMMP
jgi:hypothetical protein